jgi:hypothetical protein
MKTGHEHKAGETRGKRVIHITEAFDRAMPAGVKEFLWLRNSVVEMLDDYKMLRVNAIKLREAQEAYMDLRHLPEDNSERQRAGLRVAECAEILDDWIKETAKHVMETYQNEPTEED